MEDTTQNHIAGSVEKLAANLDNQFYMLINPKPWWCPQWLYKKILKQTIDVTSTTNIIHKKWSELENKSFRHIGKFWGCDFYLTADRSDKYSMYHLNTAGENLLKILTENYPSVKTSNKD